MKHREAFMLMNYRCDCGNHEKIWNSRDGVTPFTVPCTACGDPMGMSHVNWNEDMFVPHYQPAFGSRYFADMTIERARAYAVRNVDFMVSNGVIPESERNLKVNQMTKYYFSEGDQPDILTATTL